MFKNPLVMGLSNEEDPTKTLDGNEAGVYMSTNLSMVESTNYGNKSHGFLETPRYASKYGIESNIPIPGCGVVVEVITKGLDVRKPKISPVLEGHYNNGFEGDEWIADEVPSDHYLPTKFILSLGANDQNKIVVEVSGDDQEDLDRAITEIKIQAAKQRKQADRFKVFLEGLTEQERLNRFVVERKWQESQNQE